MSRDYLVDTSNPDALHRLLTSTQCGELLGGELVTGYYQREGHYVMRLYRDAEAIAAAVQRQFYGTVISEMTQSPAEM